MKKAAIAALCLLAAASTPASAGDTATMEVLGFSPDGKIFAFEEYGVQDGSGFPYANRFYIDTATDSFLPDTPVRVRIDDESASVAQARRQAADKGAAIASDAELAANRGFAAAANAVTELSADPHQFLFLPRAVFPPIDDPVALRLEETNFPAISDCMGATQVKGFRLLQIDPDKPGQSRVLHEDSSIPASRGCPLGYKLGAVQTLFAANGAAVIAVLIAVERVGFEGPDHRWIAVTGPLR